MKKKERETFREEGEDVLVIEDNTIYEIDKHCMKCKQREEQPKEKQNSFK